MRRGRRCLGWAAGVLAVALGGFAAFVHWRGIPRYPVEKVELQVAATPERLARGRQLAGLLCAGCHQDGATGRFTGKRLADAPPEFGEIHAPNITGHRERGIGAWSDGELAYLLRTGIRRDGRYTPPYMPKLPHASDEDLASIVAFLRSDDPWVAPADVASPASSPGFLVKLLCHVAWKPLPWPRERIVAPERSDRLAWGRYLADGLMDCYACHSADFAKLDPLRPERSGGYYGGGTRLLDASGHEILSSNLTPDRETGIGSWSEAQFVQALKGGRRPDGTLLRYPMLPYTGLSDEDAAAIFAHLRTVPPLVNRPARTMAPAPAPLGASQGQQVYTRYGCVSCHGEKGLGLFDLRRAGRKYATDEELIAFIKSPASRVPGIRMPAWEGVIREEELVPLAAYVRSLQLPEETR